MFEYIDSNGTGEIFDKLIITDESVGEVKREFVDSLIPITILGMMLRNQKFFLKSLITY